MEANKPQNQANATPTRHPAFERYLGAKSPQIRKLILDRLEAGSKFFASKNGFVVEATASEQARKAAFWGSNLPAKWLRAGKHHRHADALMALEVEGTVTVPKAYHPRHGWEEMTLTRIA